MQQKGEQYCSPFFIPNADQLTTEYQVNTQNNFF
jgi:hypothetical protein